MLQRIFPFMAAVTAVVLSLFSTLYAGEKPEITRHDATYLDRGVSIIVQWHSTNPVTRVVISAGREQKEIKVDEYDNRRNAYGYSGEVSALIPIESGGFGQPAAPFQYTVQIEDDLRLRSDVVSAKIAPPAVAGGGMPPPPPFGMMPPPYGAPPPQGDDSWGQSHLHSNVTTQPQQQPGAAGMAGGIVDKLITTMERHDVPPTLNNVKVNILSPETVSFSSKAIDDKGLREIKFRILDSRGIQVQEQVLSNLGKNWEGTTQTFQLGGGTFKVIAQAVDTAGNTSKEKIESFTLTGPPAAAQPQQPPPPVQPPIADPPPVMPPPPPVVDPPPVVVPPPPIVVPPPPPPPPVPVPKSSLSVTILPDAAIKAGAQWQLDGGAWQNSGASIADISPGRHKVVFKEVPAWGTPATVDIDLKDGANQSSGTYAVKAGNLTVTIVPASAATLGGQWRPLNAAQWLNSGASIDLPAGVVSVEFKDVAGWQKPANLSVTIVAAQKTAFSGAYARVYTFNKDFEEGALVGLEDQTIKDQLQLTKNASTLPFIWVPNSNEGTISKVDSRTGVELGRYFTGAGGSGNPSRTTVDLKGNCWVGNRNTGTVVKIGLVENGQCVDRNGDGKIETSTGPQALPWGQDECALLEVALDKGREMTCSAGQNCPGNSSGPRGIAIDASNNLWAGTYNSSMYYYINGTNGAILKKIDLSSIGHRAYGAIVDKQGILWSADMNGYVLRLDTNTNAFVKVNIGSGQYNAYGMGLDRNGYLYVAGWCSGKISAINTATAQVMWTRDTGDSCSRGIAVTNDGDFWVANSTANTVSRWANNGQKKAVIQGFSHPTGVATDADGKVWVVDYGNNNIHRINPATNAVEMTKAAGGSGHYGYSDMTGIVARSMTTKLGTWTLNFDSGAMSTGWDTVSWNGAAPNGTSIKGRVRSSMDRTAWSAWEDVAPGTPLRAVPAGRYLQVETSLQVLSGELSPVLTDLTIKPK